MTVEIRRMQPGDEADLGRVAPEVFDAPIHPGRLAAYLRAPGHLLLLAFEGGVVVGQCAAVLHRHPDKVTELYVDEIGTAATHRRQGIATRLLEAMLAWGRELGAGEAWLGTDLDNGAANGLYRKLGGRPDTIACYEFDL